MPIQNVGTLLENLVVTEAAVVLLQLCQARVAPFEFLNSFAMPPSSPWVFNPQNAGFDDDVLDKVRDAKYQLAVARRDVERARMHAGGDGR